MAMDWLKGLVGPAAQPIPAGQSIGGVPGVPSWTSFGAPEPGAAPSGLVPAGASGAPGGPPLGGFASPAPAAPAPAWGAPPPAGPAGAPAFGAPAGAPGFGPPAVAGASHAEPTMAALQAQVGELRRDVEALTLFARTLLTMLEDKQLVTKGQFQETHRKLDLLDGQLDERIVGA